MSTASKLIRPRPADGRFTSTAGLLHRRLKQLQPALAYKPASSLAEFAVWRRRVRQRLRRLLCLPRVQPQPPPVLLSEEPRVGYRLQRWEMYPEPDSAVGMLMLVPDSATPARPAPGVLCLPGSEHRNEWLAGEPDPPGSPERQFVEHNAMALHLVRQGLVALCVENPGTAGLFEPLAPDWRRQSLELIWLGWSYEGLSVFHKLVALKWFSRLPVVDRRRLAVCGHSLGAKPALLVGVLEPRLVRAVVWNSGAYDWRAYHVAANMTPVAPWHYIPGFMRWFDYLDLKAALAPTPLLITEGGRADELAKVRQAYAVAGAPGNFELSYGPSFRDPASRTAEAQPLPEGLAPAEFVQHINATNDEHYFHADVAVPWLCRVLGAAPPRQ